MPKTDVMTLFGHSKNWPQSTLSWGLAHLAPLSQLLLKLSQKGHHCISRCLKHEPLASFLWRGDVVGRCSLGERK